MIIYIIQVKFNYIGDLFMDYYQIGQNIRRFRKAQGLTQEQLAELVDISVPHMSHIETGSTKLSLPVLVDLSEALNVGADDLLKGDACVSRERMYGEIADILSQCSNTELNIMKEILRGTQSALKKYIK